MKRSENEIPPITLETTLGNAKKWLNIIRFGESGTVIQLQDDCEYRVLEVIQNRKILKSILGPYFRKYILRYIPIDQKDIQQTLKNELIKISIEKKIGTKGTLSELQNAEMLYEIATKGYEVGFFISHVTALLQKRDFQPLIDLELLIRTSKNFSVVIFSELDITHNKYNYLADKCSFLYDHLIKYPLYDENDARQFISCYNSIWKLSLPEKTVKEIITACGGYLWLIHQAQRNLRDNPSLTSKDALTDELMTKKLETIWMKFTMEEKNIIRKVFFGSCNEKDTLSHEYNYLKQIRMIKEKDNKTIPGIPLLSEVIEKETRLNTFKIQDQRIFIGETDITLKLSKKERMLMQLLFSAKRNIVSRDVVAQAVWGKNWEEKYSDWAIDRLVYRLRMRFKALGIDENLLKTVKKKGFIFG